MNSRIITDITDYIFINDVPVASDVFFLPGGSDPAIPEKAAELYKIGYAKFLIPSGGTSIKTGKFNGVKIKPEVYSKQYRTDCEFYTDVLTKNRVPMSAIIEEKTSASTKDNALLSRRIADERGLTICTALTICKSFHARRCLMCYQLAFPKTDIRVVPVDVYNITHDNWYMSEYGIDRVMGELSRCGNQFVDEVKMYMK